MLLYKEVQAENDQRIFVFGDVHGSFHLVEKAKHDLGIKEEDIKMFLGDLTDRGSENFKCVMEALRTPNSYSVRGNHDDMMIRGLLDGDGQQLGGWLGNGGQTVVTELGMEGATALAVIMEEAPFLMAINRGDKSYGFVHGGYPSILEYVPVQLLEKTIQDMWPDDVDNVSRKIADNLCWDRDMLSCGQRGFDIPPVLGVEYIFSGHSFVKEPFITSNRVYIDTGGVFNGNLTVAVIEPTGELWFYSTLEE